MPIDNHILDHIKQLLIDQDKRINRIEATQHPIDLTKKEKLIIGICYGDGIGKQILQQAHQVLTELLKKPISDNRIQFRFIEGLTIENRVAHKKAIPDDVLENIKNCDVLLKGPTTTPQHGDKWLNIESANVAMRRELDLFANVRPIKVPHLGIKWHFFRENTEGEYALGSAGLKLEKYALDFKVTSIAGTKRICRSAFEFAKKTGKKRVSIITKSNIMKATDGLFCEVAKNIAKEYEPYAITCDEYYIDIMTAHLINPKEAAGFEVMVLPNLYGDILTDQAAQIQGGVGTAGSANIGNRYAMFEAIHGSAPRLIESGLADYANPSSIIKASALLLQHIGYINEALKLEKNLDILTIGDNKLIIDPETKITGQHFVDQLLTQLNR